MSERTPIQELIRKIEMMQILDAVINPLGMIKGIATDLLEKEKEVIIDAYNEGKRNFSVHSVNESEQYYNETFKP